MNNEIKNEKKEVSTGKQMNDKDYLNSLLSTLKELNKGYTVAMTEASNEVLYNKFKAMFDEFSCLQRKVYEIMFRNGWYVLEKVESNKLTKKYNILNQEYNDLFNWMYKQEIIVT